MVSSLELTATTAAADESERGWCKRVHGRVFEFSITKYCVTSIHLVCIIRMREELGPKALICE